MTKPFWKGILDEPIWRGNCPSSIDELFGDLNSESEVITPSKYGDYHEVYLDSEIVILKRDNFEIQLIQRGSDDDYNEIYNDGEMIVLKRKTFGTKSRQSNNK